MIVGVQSATHKGNDDSLLITSDVDIRRVRDTPHRRIEVDEVGKLLLRVQVAREPLKPHIPDRVI